MDLVKEAGLELEVGVVQTAYANGASTEYLSNVLVRLTSSRCPSLDRSKLTHSPCSALPPRFRPRTPLLAVSISITSFASPSPFSTHQNVPITCVPTGVKHLHHAAESYPIGVYFEANGHGTVLFSPTALSTISSHSTPSPALASLQAVTEVINQTVGDALSDMLLVETVLLHRKWGPGEWDSAYTDLPNRLVKVFVKDRYAFSTEDAERKVVTPEGLQAGVEAIVAQTEKGRSFVRPSGTEDCVRVYAEAATRELADGELIRLETRRAERGS